MFNNNVLSKIGIDFFHKRISRRTFIKFIMALSAVFLSGFTGIGIIHSKDIKSSTGRKKKGITGKYDLVVARGDDPYEITRRAVEKLGGMKRFVKAGDTVVVKPNIAWDRTPEYAANTNPSVVAAIVELCYVAGAKRVNIFDNPCNSEKYCYENSGIRKAAEDKKARVYYMDDWNFVKAHFNYESLMEGWPVYRDAINCDVFINIPILKHHSLTGLTLSMKNLMGICGGSRGRIHTDIGRKLVDLTDFISPDLTIIDAYRVLNSHGPSGGRLNDVTKMNTVIAGTDPTLCDVYAWKLAGKNPKSIPYIREAIDRGFGNSDIRSASIFELWI